MLLYFDTYRRSNLSGREGFCFIGNRWPVQMGTDKFAVNTCLSNIVNQIFGDEAGLAENRSSRFYIPNFEKLNGVSVAGKASVEQDNQNRRGTVAQIVVCIPQTEQEEQIEIAPNALFDQMEENNVEPGTCASISVEKMRFKSMANLNMSEKEQKILHSLLWPSGRLIFFDEETEQEGWNLCNKIYCMLPKTERKKFSFITYTRSWERFCVSGNFQLVVTGEVNDKKDRLSYVQQNCSSSIYYKSFRTSEQKLREENPDAAAQYLFRIYMNLVQTGQQDLIEESGEWLKNSKLLPNDTDIDFHIICACGMALRAKKSRVNEYYPLEQETILPLLLSKLS